MRHRDLAFAGWPGGARGIAPELFRKRDEEVRRGFAFLLPFLTPRTLFAEIGSPDGELALRVAGYAERVWCIDAESRVERAPCNLRYGMPPQPVDIVCSGSAPEPAAVRRLLKPGGIWFIFGELIADRVLAACGFAKVAYYGAGVRLPRALARLARNPVTAAHA